MHLNGEVVSWDLLPLLGVNPEMGRGFRPEEEKPGTRVVLLSHALWASQFGSDRSIIGRTIHLSGDVYTIAGVMPATFRFPVDAPQNRFWTTLAVDNNGTAKAQTANRGDHELNVIGQLKPGVTITQANADMTANAARLAKQYPDTNSRHDSASVESELTAKLGDTRILLLVILGAVGRSYSLRVGMWATCCLYGRTSASGSLRCALLSAQTVHGWCGSCWWKA